MNTAAEVPADLIEVGFVRGAYGLQGWAHVQPHSGEADVLRSARQWWLRRAKSAPAAGGDAAATLLEVTGVRAQGAGLVAKWQGCDDPESAEALKGCGIAVSRARFPRLPAGQYYWVDLVGAQVWNRAGEQLGVVSAMRSNGAHDLLEVTRGAPDGAAAPAAQLLIPMVPAYVDDVDLAARCIRVDWQADW